jgi:photosystem II stability/assembly factor-like uncharacterized protein
MKICVSKKPAVYIFLVILLIMMPARFLSAQWTRQSPVPTGKEITDVCFINPETGWIFGFDGTVFRTNDGGVTWIDQSVASDDEIYAGLFLDSYNGWFALSGENQDDNAQIYGTTDGGYHWELQFLDTTCAIRDMTFIDPETGWALAYCEQYEPVTAYRNFFLKTIDGGNNWFVLDTLDESHFRSIDFINDATGFIAGSGIPNLMKTTDGGMHWSDAPHTSDASLADVFFTDSSNGYSCGKNFYYTHNSGATWNYTYCYNPNSVSMYDESNGWTVSFNQAYKVTNGGENVDYQFTSDKSILVDVSAVDASNAYVVGKHVTIYATHDGSDSWQEISNGTHKNLSSVFFLNDNEGWAGGDDRALLSTQDGGEHWIYNNLNASAYTITGIQFIAPDTGWFVNGDVYATTDGGLTWDQAAGLANPISDLYFLHDQFGWCVGQEGKLYMSMNGGNDWDIKNSGTDKDLYAVFFSDEYTGWLAGDGIVNATTDGGENWSESYVGNAKFSKIQFLDESTGYILADSFYLWTNSGGDDWDVVVPEGMNGAGTLNDLFFINQDVGYLSGSNCLLKTTDGGESWENSPDWPDMQSNAIFFINELKGWIVGDEGAIYLTETGGATSVNHPGSEDKSHIYNIFPNPARDIIRINYQIEKTSDVEIGVYTMQGTLLNHYHKTLLSPGNYIFDWDPESLPSGIYLCRIRIGDFTGSEKIIFIK